MEKEDDESQIFFKVCSMALQYSSESLRGFHPDKQISVRRKIKVLLRELEKYLGGGHSVNPHPSLVVALLGYVNQNPDLVPGVNHLIDLLRPTIGVHAHALGQHGHSNSVDMHRRAFTLLRDIYTPRPNIRRQDAVNVQSLGQLGLHLSPQTPPGNAV